MRLLGRIERAADWRENLATLVSMRLALNFALIPRGPLLAGFSCPPPLPARSCELKLVPAVPLRVLRAGVRVVISVSLEQWTGQRLEVFPALARHFSLCRWSGLVLVGVVLD